MTDADLILKGRRLAAADGVSRDTINELADALEARSHDVERLIEMLARTRGWISGTGDALGLLGQQVEATIKDVRNRQ